MAFAICSRATGGRSSGGVGGRLAAFDDPGRQLRSRAKLQLAEDVLQVDPDGPLADGQLGGDLLVREAACDQRRHLDLAPSQRARSVAGRLVARWARWAWGGRRLRRGR